MLTRIYPAGYVFLDLAGTAPAASGTIYFYVNNTTTLTTVYSDTIGTESANPLTLGADGRLPNDVYVNGSIRVRVREYHITPSSGTIVFTKDNQPNVGGQQPFYVPDYGALGPDSTAAENTAGIIAACSAIQANGGGTLLFDPITYDIYAVGTLSGTIIMNTFTSCNGVEIDGRGAELNVLDTFAGTEALFFFQFIGCVNTDVGSFTFTSIPEAAGSATTRGIRPVLFQSGCVNITYHDIVQVGGVCCFQTDRSAPFVETDKSRNITIERCDCSDVGYPLALENSGDNLRVREFKAIRPGRAVAVYGIRKFDIEMTLVDPISSPSVYLSHGVTSTTNYLENGRVNITNITSESNTTQAMTVAIYMVWDTTEVTAGVVRNIDIELNCRVVTAAADYVVFAIGKVVNGAGADATDRGHLIENVTVSGTISNAISRVGIVDLMTSYGTWGASEVVRNLSLENLAITGSGTSNIKIDIDPIVDYLRLEGVHAPAAPTITGSAQYGVMFKNCNMGVMNSDEIRYSIQTITGSGAVDIAHLFTHLNTTGGGTYSLADGREGQRKTIIMTVDAGDGVITPTSFLGNPSSTITFNDPGDTIELLFTNAAWHVLGGTATVA